MTGWTDLSFILVLVLDLFVLASSRLRAGIRAVAVQGGVLALLPVLLAGDATETRHVAVLGIGALELDRQPVPDRGGESSTRSAGPAGEARAVGRGMARELLDPGATPPGETPAAEVARLSAPAVRLLRTPFRNPGSAAADRT